MPGRYTPSRKPPWRIQLKSSADAPNASVVVDEDGDSWWAGTQLSFASVSTAIATATVGIAVAAALAQFNKPADESPYPNSIQSGESWSVVETTERRPDIGVFMANDDIVPVAQEVEQQPLPQLTTQLVAKFSVFMADDDLPRLLDEFEQQPFPQLTTQLTAKFLAWNVDEEIFPTLSVLEDSDSFWPLQQQQQRPIVSLGVPVVLTADDETVPQIIVSSEFYNLTFIGDERVASAITADDEIFPQASLVEETEWFAPRIVQLTSSLYLPDPEEISAATLFGNLDDSLGPEFRAPAAKLWTTAWQVDDEAVPSTTLQPEEEYWFQGQLWLVRPTIQSLYLPDPEEIPSGLFGNLDDSLGWTAPTLSTAKSWTSAWSDTDEVPLSLKVEEEYWFTLRPQDPIVRFGIFTDDDTTEVVPAFTPDELYWTFPVDTSTVINITGMELGGGVPSLPPLIEDEYWFPPVVIPQFKVPQVFIADDELTYIPTESSGFATFTQFAVQQDAIWRWYVSDDLPIAAAPLQIPESDWQVYTPPYPTPKFLYLPDPEEISAANLYATPYDDSDFKVHVPPYLVAKPLYLPDPEEIPAGQLFGVPNEQYTLPSFFITVPSARVVSLWQVEDEVVTPTFIFFDEDYWLVLPTQVAQPLITRFSADDEITTLVQVVVSEDEWQIPSVLRTTVQFTPWAGGDEFVSRPHEEDIWPYWRSFLPVQTRAHMLSATAEIELGSGVVLTLGKVKVSDMAVTVVALTDISPTIVTITDMPI